MLGVEEAIGGVGGVCDELACDCGMLSPLMFVLSRHMVGGVTFDPIVDFMSFIGSDCLYPCGLFALRVFLHPLSVDTVGGVAEGECFVNS